MEYSMQALKNSQGSWDWARITMSVMIICVLPLVALVYNNMADTIKTNKADAAAAIEKSEESAEKTLIQYMKLQEERANMLQSQMKEQKKIDKETIKTLQNLNVSVKLLEQQLKE